MYLRTFVCLHALLTSTPVLAHTLAYGKSSSNGGFIGEDKGKPAFKFATNLTGTEGCSDGNMKEIEDGFADMTALFAAATASYNASSQPSVEFFGSVNRTANYTDLITGNLQRAAAFGTLKGASGAGNLTIHVRCDDPMNACDAPGKWNGSRSGNHAAYNIKNEAHINFCPLYFKMDSLDRKMAKISGSPMKKEMIMSYYNRGTLWARMVMHFSSVGKAIVEQAVQGGSNSSSEWTTITSQGAMNTSVLAGVLNERPEDDKYKDEMILKYAYGATRAKLVAELSTQMNYDAVNNAENYALYAQARYIIAQKSFYPRLPIMDFSNEATVLTNANLQDGERDKYADFDSSDVVSTPRLPDRDGSASSTKLPSWWIGSIIIAATCNYALSPFG